MTLLIRKLLVPREWGNCVPDDGQSPDPMPVAAIREFMPSKNDTDGLSVFEVADERAAEYVAAALVFSGPDQQVAFAVAEREALDDAGFVIAVTKAYYFDQLVNGMHRSIPTDTMASVGLIANMFLEGDVFTFSKARCDLLLRRSAQEGRLDFLKLLKAPSEQRARGTQHLHTFLADGTIVAKAQAA